jgi:hypothetical protein
VVVKLSLDEVVQSRERAGPAFFSRQKPLGNLLNRVCSWRGCRRPAWKQLGEGRQDLAFDSLFGPKVLNERFETFVLGYYVKSGSWELGGKVTDVKGDVKVQSVNACAFDADVLSIKPELLELLSEIDWNFALIGSTKDFDLVWPATKAA